MSKTIKAILFFVVSVVIVIVGIIVGSADISVADVFIILREKIFGVASGVAGNKVSIIWTMRIPRVIMAFMVGALLSVSGAVMQSLLQNSLASAYTLGVSAGAAFGVAIYTYSGIIIPFLGMYTLPFFGLFSGMITITIIIGVSSRLDKQMSNNTIILFGMVFSLFVNAMLTIVMMLSKDTMERIMIWQMGSMAFKDWSHVAILLPVFIIGIVVLTLASRELDNLTFGDEAAFSVGIDVKKVKMFLLLFSAALTGFAVALVGIIGFVDLVIPHITRKLFGSSHRIVIPMSAILGGGFLVACDMAARTMVSPKELPIGAVTAMIGAPFFAYIYFKGGRKNA